MAKPKPVVRGPFVDGRPVPLTSPDWHDLPVPLPSVSAKATRPMERTVTIGDQLLCGWCNRPIAPFERCMCRVEHAAHTAPAVEPPPDAPAEPSLPDHLRQVVRMELGKLAGMRRFLSDDRLLERSRALAQAWADAATLEQVG